MKQISLSTTLLFGAAALIAGGCAPFTDDSTGGGSGCLASVVQDDQGAQIAINKPSVTLPAGTGTTTMLAEAFLVTQSQAVPEVQLKLDVVTPAQTQIQSNVTVQIQQDTLFTTSGNATAPTSPGAVAASGTISATGSLNAQLISTTNPTFYDFCFPGAIGVNCPTAGVGATTAGVTLTAGQFYWIVVTTSAAGTATSFVEWRGTNTSSPDFFGFANINGQGNWLPINGASTSNFNFDFKLGC